MLEIAATMMIGIVAVEHLYILWMEMFAWETTGKKVFKNAMPEELFKPTKKLAANQGLYNGFLAAGLIWSFFINNQEWKHHIAIFFLSCVVIAGVYGALTASKRILVVQALPATIALVLVLLLK